MRLRVEHTTAYRYHRPVTFNRHRLVLRPREGHDLRVEQMTLTLTPAHRLLWARDVFGNSIALVDWPEPSDELTIINDVIVERLPPLPQGDSHDSWRVPFPAQYDALEEPVIRAYQVPGVPGGVAAVKDWLDRNLTPDPEDAEATMLALCGLVYRTVRYMRRVQKGVQDPSRTLDLGTGSCRDMATLMLEAARVLGVAARFASGYFHCAASMAGYASTHAWTEVYLPTLGWRGFDPTTGTATGARHLATGVSSHPRGVMPVSGTFIGAATDYQDLRVSVKTEELPVTG
jgi:transglutaminase-like putative cysteine protease